MTDGQDGEGESRPQGLDKDLKRIGRVEQASLFLARPLAITGLVLCSLVLALTWMRSGGGAEGGVVLATGLVLALYLALMIGANDVANNMGPAVGARVISLRWALVLSAACEIGGAVLYGSHVSHTIGVGLLGPDIVGDGAQLVRIMLAALLSAAFWINLATLLGAPVSTTHAMVGAVLGGAVSSGGVSLAAIAWHKVALVVAAWVATPFAGALAAVALLALLERMLDNRIRRLASARRWIPVLVGTMVGMFVLWVELRRGDEIDLHGPHGVVLAVLTAAIAFVVARGWIRRVSEGMEGRNREMRELFALPLLVAAALMSFSHGANDVANIVGPVAAIARTLGEMAPGGAAGVPLWTLALGGAGIGIGVLAFGPRMVRLVGNEITRLNPVRAFCVLYGASLTVGLATSLGAPVSTTHTVIGALFGIGFYREWRQRRPRLPIGGALPSDPAQRQRHLVRRSHLWTVLAAWVVTVPAVGLISALMVRLFAA